MALCLANDRRVFVLQVGRVLELERELDTRKGKEEEILYRRQIKEDNATQPICPHLGPEQQLLGVRKIVKHVRRPRAVQLD